MRNLGYPIFRLKGHEQNAQEGSRQSLLITLIQRVSERVTLKPGTRALKMSRAINIFRCL